jgi:hypothetical protein
MKRYSITKYTSGQKRRECWFDNKGKLHRGNDIPAVITYMEDGRISDKQWWIHGMKHRNGDKPAYMSYGITFRTERVSLTSYWYYYGELHRECGSAIKATSNSFSTYSLFGENIETEEEYNNIISTGKQIKLDRNAAILYIKSPIKYLRVLSQERLSNV